MRADDPLTIWIAVPWRNVASSFRILVARFIRFMIYHYCIRSLRSEKSCRALLRWSYGKISFNASISFGGMLNSFTALKDTLIIRVYLNSFPGIQFFPGFLTFPAYLAIRNTQQADPECRIHQNCHRSAELVPATSSARRSQYVTIWNSTWIIVSLILEKVYAAKLLMK